jgi:glycosidase
MATTGSRAATAGNPTVTRAGSHLAVQLNAAYAGTWTIEDDAGHVCATGNVGPGANSIHLEKIAAPTDVRLRLTTRHGDDVVSEIPGIVRRSKLLKPDRDAVIYQVPVRTYVARGNGRAQVGTFNALNDATLREIHDLGVDYLWLTGVLEQASLDQTDPDVVKGEAGSYYAIYDSWDVSGQLGTLDDFDALIDRAHAAGLRVLIDFVSNHTARMHRTDIACKQHLDFGRSDKTDVSFDQDNNYYYIVDSHFTPPPQNGVAGADGVFDTDVFAPGVQPEAPARVTGNDIVSASPGISDWFETVKLNYGWDLVHKQAFYTPTPRTWEQMLDVARYWIDKGVDGFRLDFAHAVPIEFWRHFAAELKAVQPQVFLLAEAYESDGP